MLRYGDGLPPRCLFGYADANSLVDLVGEEGRQGGFSLRGGAPAAHLAVVRYESRRRQRAEKYRGKRVSVHFLQNDSPNLPLRRGSVLRVLWRRPGLRAGLGNVETGTFAVDDWEEAVLFHRGLRDSVRALFSDFVGDHNKHVLPKVVGRQLANEQQTLRAKSRVVMR